MCLLKKGLIASHFHICDTFKLNAESVLQSQDKGTLPISI